MLLRDLDANIREIVRDYVKEPVRIEIGVTSKPSDRVELRVYTVMQDQKLGLLDQMLKQEEGTFSSSRAPSTAPTASRRSLRSWATMPM